MKLNILNALIFSGVLTSGAMASESTAIGGHEIGFEKLHEQGYRGKGQNWGSSNIRGKIYGLEL